MEGRWANTSPVSRRKLSALARCDAFDREEEGWSSCSCICASSYLEHMNSLGKACKRKNKNGGRKERGSLQWG